MNQSAERPLAPDMHRDDLIHALADGALDEAQAQQAIDLLLAEPALRAVWDEVHWVGDALRSEETGAVGATDAFLLSFSARLAAEPTVLAPPLTGGRSRWLRFGVPGAAAAAAAGFVVWMAMPLQQAAVVGQAVVPAAAPVVETAQAKVAPVDAAQLREYFNAHQELGAGGLHGPGAIQAASYNMVADEGRGRP